jgi:hypothetical protein
MVRIYLSRAVIVRSLADPTFAITGFHGDHLYRRFKSVREVVTGARIETEMGDIPDTTRGISDRSDFFPSDRSPVYRAISKSPRTFTAGTNTGSE